MSRNGVPHDRLFDAHTEAQRFYRQQLLASPVAHGPCHYLAQRRLAHVLAPDSIWQAGYAPARWTDLVDHLTHLGFAEGELLAAGLTCRSRRGGIIDRFRDRIMFPQRDGAGHVVGFIGRAAPGAPGEVPKYLNSPSTDIYDKSDLLFGLHEQRETLTSGARLAVVEGPLDVLAVAASNVEAGPHLAAVASCGTALTTKQAALLAHYRGGRGAVVAYDGDEAGSRASAAAYELFTDCQPALGEQLLAAVLPRGSDPAEILQVHGMQAVRNALTDPGRLIPLGQHAIDTELQDWAHVLDGAEGRIAAVRAVAPLVAKLPRSAVAAQVTRLAERVRLDPTTVTIALTDALTTARPTQRRPSGQESRSRASPVTSAGLGMTRTACVHLL